MEMYRVGHTATLLPNEKVMVAGGDAGHGTGWASAEFYDPATGTFSVPQLMTARRRDWHTSTLMPDGKVFIFGGSPVDDLPEYYDGSTFNLRYACGLDARRYRHTATLLHNGKVLLAGGDGLAGYPLSSADLYDDNDPCPSSYSSATGSMTTPREEHTATLLPNGAVLIAGGLNDNWDTSSSAELYDPATETFITTGPMTTPREGHTATLLPNGKVLIAGGYNGNDASFLGRALCSRHGNLCCHRVNDDCRGRVTRQPFLPTEKS